MQTPFGWTASVFSFDVFGLENHADKTGAALWAIWAGIVAPATTRQTSLYYIEFVDWKASPLAQVYVGLPLSGRLVRPVGPRSQQGVMILHDDLADDFSGRRFFTPGMPREWCDGELLTDAGWDNLMNLIGGWACGAMGYFGNGQLSLLNAHPHSCDEELGNLGGVGFRLVSSLRVCQYVDKAPTLSTDLWP